MHIKTIDNDARNTTNNKSIIDHTIDSVRNHKDTIDIDSSNITQRKRSISKSVIIYLYRISNNLILIGVYYLRTFIIWRRIR